MTTKQTVPAPRSAFMKGIRRDTSDGENLARGSNVKLRCGDCMHWKGTAHPSMGKPCHELGITAKATAPTCYTANLSVFRDLPVEQLQTLASLVVCMTPQHQRVMMGLLRGAASLERVGLKFMQTVYFSTGKGLVLSDYYRGFACARGPGGTVMVVGMQYLKGQRAPVTAMLEKDSLLTKKQFLKAKEKLVAAGALEHLPARRVIAIMKDGYEPPTLDTATEYLEANANKMKRAYGDKVRHEQQRTWTIDQSQGEAEATQHTEAGDGL